ncbi:MAG: nucleic acid-binding protein [Nitrospirae bacterium]|nr:MAG: nucleic acid-binding protein [Nitrospirota bacterium]HSV26573.1 type II toxin-antitoxin system VapC family toxin [Sedimentisphaerales bacterium]
MIVVDSNIIAHLYLNSERSEEVELILRKDPDWAEPILWRSEFRNVLAFYVRKRILDLAASQCIMAAAEARMSGFEYEVHSADVLRMAAESDCSAYYCEFVVLAQRPGVRFVTSDRQVLARFPDGMVSPIQFLQT